VNRGIVYLHMRRYALAVAELDHAIRLRPKSAFAHANRAVAHLFLGSQAKFDADVAKARALGASDKTVKDLKAYAAYYDKKKKREDKE
jgi:Tfp pilus assembly protein PilF